MFEHLIRELKPKYGAVRMHCFGWFCFIIYDAIIGGLVTGRFGTFGNYLVHYILNISLFYFHALVVLPAALKNPLKSIFLLPVLLVGELTLYQITVFSIDYMLIHYTNVLATNKVHLDKSFVLAYIWRGLYFMLFSTGYYLFRLYKAGRDENELLKQTHYTYQLNKIAMEKRLAQSKTAFLLTQINPHFLFNTLNFIYYTTVKTSPEGANSIMLLSRIMRYSANIENAGSFVPLNQEIEYVRWLMEIHQIRLKDNFFVSFSYSAETTGWKIIPFLLVTVAENMFKHGEISDGLQTAKLDVFLDEEKNLIITSFNKKKRLSDSSGLKSGLINLQERMIHYYDDQALLEYHHHEDGYFRLRIFVPHLFKDIDQSPERSLQQKS